RGKSTASGGKFFFPAPDARTHDGIPRVERSAILSARVHFDIRAEERSAFDVVGLDGFHLLAQVVLRDVEEARSRRESGWLPILAAGGRRADIADGLADLRLLLGNLARPAALRVH